jgi:hypothetical protein
MHMFLQRFQFMRVHLNYSFSGPVLSIIPTNSSILGSRDSSVGRLATGWTAEGSRFESQ